MTLFPGLALVKPSAVAQVADVSPGVIYRMIREGRLDARKVGKHWRVTRAAALELLGVADDAPTLRPAPVARPQLSRKAEAIVRAALGR